MDCIPVLFLLDEEGFFDLNGNSPLKKKKKFSFSKHVHCVYPKTSSLQSSLRYSTVVIHTVEEEKVREKRTHVDPNCGSPAQKLL